LTSTDVFIFLELYEWKNIYIVSQIGSTCIGISVTVRATETVKWGRNKFENF